MAHICDMTREYQKEPTPTPVAQVYCKHFILLRAVGPKWTTQLNRNKTLSRAQVSGGLSQECNFRLCEKRISSI